MEGQFQWLFDDIEKMVKAAATDQGISSSDLRRVLRFISEAVQVFEQLFQSVYTILVEFQFLTDDDVGNPERLQKLKKELALILGSQDYLHGERFLGRLRKLTGQYEDLIEPITHHLEHGSEWYYALLSMTQVRGGFLLNVHLTISWLISQLEQPVVDLVLIRQTATEEAEALRVLLHKLYSLRDRILGLSGEPGFLELTETDRSLLEKQVTVFLHQDHSVTYGPRVHAEGASGQIAVGKQISQRRNLSTYRSPWISGSFYLAAMVIITTFFLVVAQTVHVAVLPVVIIGAMLAVSLVGAFQLRQDASLSEKNFLSLMALTFQYIPLLRRRKTGDENSK